MKNALQFSLIILTALFFACSPNPPKEQQSQNESTTSPNFLFCIADDWSFPHAGAYGDSIIKTPHFDRIAHEGVLFMNAFTASPSCAPSRAAILTGQDIWRLEEGALLFGALSSKIPVYTRLLLENNYDVGHTGKGYTPADLKRGGWEESPAGKPYQEIEMDAPPKMRKTDYLYQREMELKLLTEKIAFFVLSILFGVLTLNAQSHTINLIETHNFFEKILFAGYGLLMYTIKSLIPFQMSAFHPYPIEGHTYDFIYLLFLQY